MKKMGSFQIIKNILNKIKIHPLFYLIILLCLLTGHFRNIIYFTIIILVHELGHSIIGILLGFKLNNITIYPYGGNSNFTYLINTKIYKELLVVLAGPLAQIIFTYLIYLLKVDVSDYFYYYSKLILIFNLIPILPLDGGKLLNIILEYFLSYYNSLKVSLYISYIIYLVSFFLLLNNMSLTIILVYLLLGFNLYKENKKVKYYYNKFLLERITKKLKFTKIKKVNSIYKMKKDYYHYFYKDLVKEEIVLNKYYKSIKNVQLCQIN